jgi:hypothetical protein
MQSETIKSTVINKTIKNSAIMQNFADIITQEGKNIRLNR